MKSRYIWQLVVLFGTLVAACKSDGPQATATNATGTSDSMAMASLNYYNEPHRPQVHFSPETGWMNDPNGLVFYEGAYHLFYQHNPDSTVWGPMHWGHAISTDLVHWDHLPIALYPDELGTIFSGSVVVDSDNTSGLGEGDKAPLVAIFTYHDAAGEAAGRKDFQTQGLAYSNDGGIRWTKFERNPVLPNPGLKDFRDPKVFFHKPSERWVMALAAGDRVKFYTSPDLKTWEFASDFGPNKGSSAGGWECPDLFPIREYLSSDLRYALIVSVQEGGPAGGNGTSYFIGDFDGKKFKATAGVKETLWLDRGADNYAFVTFANSPTPENRQLGIGWMSNWQYAQKVPTDPWRSAMTLPRSLTLHNTERGERLKLEMVPDLFQIRGRRLRFNRMSDIIPTNLWSTLSTWDEHVYDFNISTPEGAVPDFTLTLSTTLGDTLRLGYDKSKAEYFIDRTGIRSATFDHRFRARHTAARQVFAKAEILRIVIDHSSVELLADDGFTAMTDSYFLAGEVNGFGLTGDIGTGGTVYALTEALPTPGSVARVKLGI